MSLWKTKVFGDNWINFYGWVACGLFLIAVSLVHVILAVRAGAGDSPAGLLLIAIYFVLLGSFGLGLQNYLARLARKLDGQAEPKDENPAA